MFAVMAGVIDAVLGDDRRVTTREQSITIGSGNVYPAACVRPRLPPTRFFARGLGGSDGAGAPWAR